MSKREKKRLIRIIISFIFFILGLIFKENFYFQLAIFIISYLIVSYDIIIKAFKTIIHGQFLDENFLMAIASLGAFFLKEFSEAVAVMLFYQIGEFFQSYALDKSRKSIASLMDIRPDYANLYIDGEIKTVSPDEVNIDDEIIVKAGEKVPLDGVIVEGSSSLDTKALTGESLPKEVSVGNNVFSGCINLNGTLRIKVTKAFSESTVSKILELVENASDKKTKSENFITKFAKYYTPIVVGLAVILAIIPPLVFKDSFATWINRALTFLVISCPCALVISVPLSFFGGIGGASKQGILVKGSNYLEALASINTIVFDKTGTLTKGNFTVTKIIPKETSKEKVLEIAAYAENFSNHPIALSIKEAYKKEIDEEKIKDIEEIPGYGIKLNLDNHLTLVGNEKLMKKYNIVYSKSSEIGTLIYVASDYKFLGIIVIEDEIKADSQVAINTLKGIGIKDLIMLTGDAKKVGSKVANALGINNYYTDLLPADKVDKLEMLLKDENRNVAFVGDGINDAPVLARADVGIAMGGLGSDAAIEASDVVIMTDEPSKIATAIKISRKTVRLAKENIYFAITIKIVFLILGVIGLASMWAAVFADVGVSMIAILNAMRALNVKK